MKLYICILLFSIFTQYSSGASRCNTVFTALISNVETRTFYVNVGANFFTKMFKVNLNEIAGTRYGRLTIIGESETKKFKDGKPKQMALCRCDCGTEKPQSFVAVKNGNTKSCGCLKRENHMRAVVKHGCARDSGHSGEYASWAAMKSRCHDIHAKGYENYGGRGITVCERWNKFENFLEDMGQRPVQGKYVYSIERINNDLGYFKENCKWATYAEQAINKRLNINTKIETYGGVTRTRREWARIFGINPGTLQDRMYASKMTFEEAIAHKYRAIRPKKT